MDSFVIYSFNGNVSIYQQIDETLEVLKNRGEEEQNYNAHFFWSWWREKVEYEEEEVSFFVVTDNQEFTIPNDISIANKNSLSQNIINELLLTLPLNSEVLTFPKIEDLKTTKRDEKVFKQEETKIPTTISNPSLATFFRKKTKEMRG